MADATREADLLGAVVMYSTSDEAQAALSRLRPADFVANEARGIWGLILARSGAGKPIDEFALGADHAIEDSPEYRTWLYAATTAAAEPRHIRELVQTVLDASARRQIAQACEAALRAADSDKPAVDILGGLDQALRSIRAVDVDRTTWDLRDLLHATIDEVERRYLGKAEEPIATGIVKLDELLAGGFRRGELIYLAARPGMGKSALALNIASHVARCGKRVGVWSLEMSPQLLGERYLSSEGRVDGSRLKRPKGLTEADWPKLARAAGAIERGRVVMHTDTRTSPDSFRRDVMRMQGSGGLDLAVIDYLGLMDLGRRRDEEALSGASRSLALTALDRGIPVLCLAQLNRESVRDNRTPTLHNLRGSGTLEQDASTVVFIHRSEDEGDDQTHLIIAKQRSGPTGSVDVVWRPSFVRFDNPGPTVVRDYSTARWDDA
jgi:replicative DNA helicase